jgi:hypothetical protein
MNKTYHNLINRFKVFALVILTMFCMAEKMHAQLPAGVTFDGYLLEKSASQNPPVGNTTAQYWIAEQGTPDLDNMDIYVRNLAPSTWTANPATLFPSTVTYIIIGAYSPATNIRAESFSTNISGLTVNAPYMYSFIATSNNYRNSTYNPAATSLTLGLYFNGTLVASKVLPVNAVASRHYFNFTAPATSGTLSIGVVSAVGGDSGNTPWYQIAGGSGQFEVSCNAGSTAPPLSASTLNNVCPVNTVDLNSLHTGTAPGISQLVWFTNNAHTGTAYATPTAAIAGTYYAFYYDSNSGGCYSPASSAVTVTTTNCCTAGSTGPDIN